MLLVYQKVDTKEIGVAFVSDNDAEVLQAVGYYHCIEKDFIDEKSNGKYVEVWQSCNKIEGNETL